MDQHGFNLEKFLEEREVYSEEILRPTDDNVAEAYKVDRQQTRQ